MKVNLCYNLKGLEGTFRSLKKEMSIKEAEEYYKKNLKDDPLVLRVWLRYFDGWHYRTKKILKEAQDESL